MSLILSGTDGLSDVDGSAATPAIRGTDANTGIFFPAADTIAFSEGGVEVARFNSSGQLGVGTATVATNFRAQFLGTAGSNTSAASSGTTQSASAVLRLQAGGGFTGTLDIGQGGGTGSWLQSCDTANLATTYPLLLNPVGGNVGVGTSTPLNVLDVVNTQSNGTGIVTTTRLNHSGTSAGDGPRLLFTSGTSTTGGCAIAGYGTSLNAADMLFYAGGNTERMRLATGSFFYSGASGATTAEAVGTITWLANGSAPYISHNIDAQGSGFTYNIFKRVGSTIGNIQYNGSGVTYVTSSDYRLKENVRPATNALDRVAKLKPCFFNWKESGAEELGFIAHELQEEFPHAVAGEKDAVEVYTDEEGNEQTRIKPQGIDTSFLVATLTAAIQEQQAIITALTARITALETP